MSHEMLRRAAEHLQNSSNPAYVEGGMRLGEMADILLEYEAIPLTDPSLELLVLGEESVLGPTFVARDFELETATRKILKDGEHVETLTPTEFSLMERLLIEPGVVVPREKIAQHMYDGLIDKSSIEGVKVFITRIRRKLPVDNKTAIEIIETIRDAGLRYNHFEKEE